MIRFSKPMASALGMILGVGVTVLIGCQNTTVDATRGALSVENSTAATVPETAAANQAVPTVVVETVEVAVPRAVPQPPPPVARPAAVPVYAAATRTASPTAPAKPVFVTVPARTVLPVELDKTLSSHSSQVGESFRALLNQDVAVNGRTALPKGSVVVGRVTEAKPAKKVGGRARLSLEFYSIELPNGQQVPLDVVLAQVGKSSTTKDAAIIGGSTLGGAVIGHAVNKGEGTAIGAIVGGLAGAAVANETRAKPVVVNSGTMLTLELLRPLTVEAAG